MSKKQQLQGHAGGRQAGPSAPPPAPAVSGDAPPSNTASHKYDEGKGYRLLRVGVDSLYLSFHGELFPDVESELAQRKYLAQSRYPDEKALAQWQVGDHVFEVLDRGQTGFAYVLQDNAYRICLRSEASGSRPAAYVKVSAELLAHKEWKAVIEELGQIVQTFGQIDGVGLVSRIDLYADFQTDIDIGAIPQGAWVTQAGGIDTYRRHGKFTGWVFGAGGIESGRLYDKTVEIQKSGKTFFHELWRRAGWDGESTVWRLEFQYRREVLAAFGIRRTDRIGEYLGGMWLSSTNHWLRLTVPDPSDSNRARWPMHPTWARLAEIRWRLDDVPVTRSYSPARVPSIERLCRLFVSLVTSFMAVKGIREYDAGVAQFTETARTMNEARCKDRLGISFLDWIAQQVAIKVRQFNTRLNIRTPKQEATTPDEVDRDASAYYDKTRGS